ncbi:hypothetical protein NQ317_012634 [Molorchus minor]|uniref:Uncharacterized protein n=1 Tax=Molorchus minor TaxID=1323400 RepID=A0ABQ9J5X1_9CUCU|nr:hypothetical protein NQ317_012634 [Molorchus minor]
MDICEDIQTRKSWLGSSISDICKGKGPWSFNDGKDVIKSRWSLIKDSLSKPIKNSRELEAAILSYNSSLPRFLALHYFFEEEFATKDNNVSTGPSRYSPWKFSIIEEKS